MKKDQMPSECNRQTEKKNIGNNSIGTGCVTNGRIVGRAGIMRMTWIVFIVAKIHKAGREMGGDHRLSYNPHFRTL